MAIRFRFRGCYDRLFVCGFILFRLAGFRSQWMAALVMAIPVFPIRLPRDLPAPPNHTMLSGFDELSLPHSIGSVPR
jgi:hypothetical protein